MAQRSRRTISVVSGGLACVIGALLLGAVIPAVRHSRLFDPDDEPRLRRRPPPGVTRLKLKPAPGWVRAGFGLAGPGGGRMGRLGLGAG